MAREDVGFDWGSAIPEDNSYVSRCEVRGAWSDGTGLVVGSKPPP